LLITYDGVTVLALDQTDGILPECLCHRFDEIQDEAADSKDGGLWWIRIDAVGEKRQATAPPKKYGLMMMMTQVDDMTTNDETGWILILSQSEIYGLMFSDLSLEERTPKL